MISYRAAAGRVDLPSVYPSWIPFPGRPSWSSSLPAASSWSCPSDRAVFPRSWTGKNGKGKILSAHSTIAWIFVYICHVSSQIDMGKNISFALCCLLRGLPRVWDLVLVHAVQSSVYCTTVLGVFGVLLCAFSGIEAKALRKKEKWPVSPFGRL